MSGLSASSVPGSTRQATRLSSLKSSGMSKGILPGCGDPAVPDCARASVPQKKTANAIQENETRKKRNLFAIANLSLLIFDLYGQRAPKRVSLSRAVQQACASKFMSASTMNQATPASNVVTATKSSAELQPKRVAM